MQVHINMPLKGFQTVCAMFSIFGVLSRDNWTCSPTGLGIKVVFFRLVAFLSTELLAVYVFAAKNIQMYLPNISIQRLHSFKYQIPMLCKVIV